MASTIQQKKKKGLNRGLNLSDKGLIFVTPTKENSHCKKNNKIKHRQKFGKMHEKHTTYPNQCCWDDSINVIHLLITDYLLKSNLIFNNIVSEVIEY